MRKLFALLVLWAFVLAAVTPADAQVLRKLDRIKKSVEDATRTAEKREERKRDHEERTNPASVEKSAFHEQRIGRILFATGAPNPGLEDEGAFVSTLDLSTPSFFNVYLEDPMYAIHARTNKLEEYSVVSPSFIRNYYIDGELIASYTEVIDGDDFRRNIVYADVFVPSTNADFEDNEMRVGVLAHVFSSLNPGTHKLKVEYVKIKSTPKPSSTGSAATEYDNEEYVIASGEVDVKIDAGSLDKYCRQYGRPKFSKGVLEGETKLEQQLIQLVRNDTRKRQPIYMYGSDSWKIIRGALDRIVGREARIYYVFTNDKGRCELGDFVVHQAYEGNGYGAPTFGVSTYVPAFKYVVCQNY